MSEVLNALAAQLEASAASLESDAAGLVNSARALRDVVVPVNPPAVGQGAAIPDWFELWRPQLAEYADLTGKTVVGIANQSAFEAILDGRVESGRRYLLGNGQFKVPAGKKLLIPSDKIGVSVEASPGCHPVLVKLDLGNGPLVHSQGMGTQFLGLSVGFAKGISSGMGFLCENSNRDAIAYCKAMPTDDTTYSRVGNFVMTRGNCRSLMVHGCVAPQLKQHFVYAGAGCQSLLLSENVAVDSYAESVVRLHCQRAWIIGGRYENPTEASGTMAGIVKGCIRLMDGGHYAVVGVVTRYGSWEIGPLGGGDGTPGPGITTIGVFIDNCVVQDAEQCKINVGASDILIRNTSWSNRRNPIFTIQADSAVLQRYHADMRLSNCDLAGPSTAFIGDTSDVTLIGDVTMNAVPKTTP